MNLTIERLHALSAVSQVTKESEFNVAQIQGVIECLGKTRGAVAKMLTFLHQEGYLENPMRGCWRLTPLGAKEVKLYEKRKRRKQKTILPEVKT